MYPNDNSPQPKRKRQRVARENMTVTRVPDDPRLQPARTRDRALAQSKLTYWAYLTERSRAARKRRKSQPP